MKENSLIWVLKQVRNRIPEILLLTVAQILNALFSVLFALGTRGVIDSAVSGDSNAFIMACLFQMVIIGGILFSLTLSRHLKDNLSAKLDRDWKQQLLHGLLHGDYAQVKSYHSAELLNRLNADVAKVNEGLLVLIPGAAAMIMRLTAAVVILGVMDARFTMIVTALGLLVVAVTGLLRRHLKEINKLVSTHDGRVSGYLQEAMEKLLIVQSMDISEEVEHRASNIMDARYQIQRRRKNISLMANTGVSLMFYAAGFFALCWCSWRMLQGQMSFGSLTAVIQLVNQIQYPVVNLSSVLPQYIAILASAERLMELESIQGQPQPMKENRDAVYEQMYCILAENLTFSYDRDKILDNADFMLPKGAFAVITGASGIGKSTLLKMILGVYPPESGEIYLKLDDRRMALDRSTRKLFAYVPQGNMLLSGTIRDNLTIVKPDAMENEIREAIYVSAMDEFLSQLPQGLDTVLGESGTGLSEGQAQRLAIARAILGGAPILLLDECTSALDEHTEHTVLRRIRALPGRTCIAVTHRPAAISLCDWRLQIESGKIHAVWVDSRLTDE